MTTALRSILVIIVASLVAAAPASTQRPAAGRGEGGRLLAGGSLVPTREASADNRVRLNDSYEIKGPPRAQWLHRTFEYYGDTLRLETETAPVVVMHMDLCEVREQLSDGRCQRPVYRWRNVRVRAGRNPETLPSELVSGGLTSQYVLVWYRDDEPRIRNSSTPFSIHPGS